MVWGCDLTFIELFTQFLSLLTHHCLLLLPCFGSCITMNDKRREMLLFLGVQTTPEPMHTMEWQFLWALHSKQQDENESVPMWLLKKVQILMADDLNSGLCLSHHSQKTPHLNGRADSWRAVFFLHESKDSCVSEVPKFDHSCVLSFNGSISNQWFQGGTGAKIQSNILATKNHNAQWWLQSKLSIRFVSAWLLRMMMFEDHCLKMMVVLTFSDMDAKQLRKILERRCDSMMLMLSQKSQMRRDLIFCISLFVMLWFVLVCNKSHCQDSGAISSSDFDVIPDDVQMMCGSKCSTHWALFKASNAGTSLKRKRRWIQQNSVTWTGHDVMNLCFLKRKSSEFRTPARRSASTRVLVSPSVRIEWVWALRHCFDVDDINGRMSFFWRRMKPSSKRGGGGHVRVAYQKIMMNNFICILVLPTGRNYSYFVSTVHVLVITVGTVQ